MTADIAERKRTQDRINQRYSRAKKKAKVGELESHIQHLSAKLAEAEAEIQRLRKRDTAFRTTLKNAQKIFSQREDEVDEHDILNEETAMTTPQSMSDAATSTTDITLDSFEPCLVSTEQLENENALGFPLTYQLNARPSEYLLDLPLDYGVGATVNLLDNDFWNPSDPALSESPHWNMSYEVVPQLESVGVESGVLLSSDLPDWQVLPLHLPATTLLDEVLLRTTESARQWTRTAGKQHDELTHPSFPSISSLLNPSPNDSGEHPIATAVSAQVWKTIITSFTARVAFYYIVANILRWYVAPSERTYNLIPDHMKPTKLQRTIPHPPWVDIVCWPEARDAVLTYMDMSQFDEYRRLSSTTLSIHWPYSDSDVFLSSSDGKQLLLNPVFVAHIRNVKVGPRHQLRFIED